MRGHHPIGVGGGRGRGLRRANASWQVEAGVDQGGVVVGRVAVWIGTNRVYPIGRVATVGVVRWRETPVPVAGLDQAVVDLRPDRVRMVQAPALRPPFLFGYEQRRHEVLEGAPAPARRDPHPGVLIGAL